MAQRTCTIDGCDKPHRAKGLCVTHYNQQMPEGKRHPKVTAPCVVCDAEVTRLSDRRRRPVCSVRCRTLLQWGVTGGHGYDWAKVAVQRARRLGARRVELVYREDVLARDGWRCYACGADTKDVADPFDPRSATVDHVVPLSRGGEHTMSNMRCCCLHCNSAKQERDISSAA